MDLTVLGCSGGVGTDLRTTTLLVDNDVLIDAGTGVGDLSLDAMAQIKHIFLTHSHLDHIAGIPLFVDSIFERITSPVTIYGLPETLSALKQHIFNNVIWPDFSKLPADSPVIKYQDMRAGQVAEINNRTFESIAVNHVVPGAGYRVACPTGCFAFSGDTSTNDSFWQALNAHDSLDLLLVEAAFANTELDLCKMAGHYCAELLGEDIKKLAHRPRIYISHNKPGQEDVIFNECKRTLTGHEVHRLTGDTHFTL